MKQIAPPIRQLMLQGVAQLLRTIASSPLGLRMTTYKRDGGQIWQRSIIKRHTDSPYLLCGRTSSYVRNFRAKNSLSKVNLVKKWRPYKTCCCGFFYLQCRNLPLILAVWKEYSRLSLKAPEVFIQLGCLKVSFFFTIGSKWPHSVFLW